MLRVFTNPRVLLSIAVVAGLIAVALWPRAVLVEVTKVARGPILVTISEEGETRVRDRFVVSAPLAGRLQRVELQPGDRVKRGDVIARLRPEAPPLLDARAQAEARAAVQTARATVGRARAEEQRARAALALAERERARARELAAEGLTTAQQVELRDSEARTAGDAVDAAAYAAQAAAADLVRAEARLAAGGGDPGADRIVAIPSPIDGLVLRRIRESESIVPAGEPLVELGDPSRLEIVSDLLSTDAVKVKPGARVLVEQWGGDKALTATVRRVEPSGFTKVSALGVEEQRVNVIADFDDAADAFEALGDAYRVEVRIVVAEAPSVVTVPTSALFRAGEQWAVYQMIDGRAQRTPVTLGLRTGREAEVTDGLSEGATVIVHPGDTIEDGSRVALRTAGAG
jgi:HlyD family secretion protein